MNAKQKAGSAGGKATLARHGKEHMARIGKKGAESTWRRYYLAPFELASYALVERETGKIRAIW